MGDRTGACVNNDVLFLNYSFNTKIWTEIFGTSIHVLRNLFSGWWFLWISRSTGTLVTSTSNPCYTSQLCVSPNPRISGRFHVSARPVWPRAKRTTHVNVIDIFVVQILHLIIAKKEWIIRTPPGLGFMENSSHTADSTVHQPWVLTASSIRWCSVSYVWLKPFELPLINGSAGSGTQIWHG